MRFLLFVLVIALQLTVEVKASEKLTRLPIDENFIKPITGRHGIVFNFLESVSMYIHEDGKIVYVGKLDNYGKVILIEHFPGRRSVSSHFIL